jgi:hypothetical protein
MSRKVTISLLALLVVVCMAWGAEKTFTGVISDSNCGLKHSSPSDEAAACVAKCVEGGGKYVLVSGGKVYQLDPQDKIAKSMAGREVRIKGEASGDTIKVASATAAAAKKAK